MTVATNIEQVRNRIGSACCEAERDPRDVGLLVVSKTFDAAAVREAHAAGERRFGENYVQEALAKLAALTDLRSVLEWHLIGPLQSNKTREVAENFDWVHSVDRLRIAQRLSEQRPENLPPLQICLQVNTSNEASKSGVSPSELSAIAHEIHQLPRLTLRGLMAVPEPSSDVAVQRANHAALRKLLVDLQQAGLPLDTLSMGMTDDLEAAIAEGTTLVRIGRAIFGNRTARDTSVQA